MRKLRNFSGDSSTAGDFFVIMARARGLKLAPVHKLGRYDHGAIEKTVTHSVAVAGPFAASECGEDFGRCFLEGLKA